MLNQPPMMPPPMMPPAPPGFGQPGYVGDPNRLPMGMGGGGNQGGGGAIGGGGSSGLGGGGPGPKGSQAGGYGRGGSYAMASGGYVPGDRTAPVDSQPVNATAGEFMLNRGAAEALGPRVLAALNDTSTASMLGMMLERFLSQQGGGRSY
jgi:hypothetical protein